MLSPIEARNSISAHLEIVGGNPFGPKNLDKNPIYLLSDLLQSELIQFSRAEVPFSEIEAFLDNHTHTHLPPALVEQLGLKAEGLTWQLVVAPTGLSVVLLAGQVNKGEILDKDNTLITIVLDRAISIKTGEMTWSNVRIAGIANDSSGCKRVVGAGYAVSDRQVTAIAVSVNCQELPNTPDYQQYKRKLAIWKIDNLRAGLITPAMVGKIGDYHVIEALSDPDGNIYLRDTSPLYILTERMGFSLHSTSDTHSIEFSGRASPPQELFPWSLSVPRVLEPAT